MNADPEGRDQPSIQASDEQNIEQAQTIGDSELKILEGKDNVEQEHPVEQSKPSKVTDASETGEGKSPVKDPYKQDKK